MKFLVLTLASTLLFACYSSDPRLSPGKEDKPSIALSTKFELLPLERSGIDFILSIRGRWQRRVSVCSELAGGFLGL